MADDHRPKRRPGKLSAILPASEPQPLPNAAVQPPFIPIETTHSAAIVAAQEAVRQRRIAAITNADSSLVTNPAVSGDGVTSLSAEGTGGVPSFDAAAAGRAAFNANSAERDRQTRQAASHLYLDANSYLDVDPSMAADTPLPLRVEATAAVNSAPVNAAPVNAVLAPQEVPPQPSSFMHSGVSGAATGAAGGLASESESLPGAEATATAAYMAPANSATEQATESQTPKIVGASARTRIEVRVRATGTTLPPNWPETRAEILRSIDAIDSDLNLIRPVLERLEASRSTIGGNSPPEPIEDAPLTLADLKITLVASASLRDQVSAERGVDWNRVAELWQILKWAAKGVKRLIVGCVVLATGLVGPPFADALFQDPEEFHRRLGNLATNLDGIISSISSALQAIKFFS